PATRPPEPVDVESPQWVARAWQWVFDQLRHVDECVDEMKQTQTEFHAEVNALMSAKMTDHATILEMIERHEAEHKAIEQAKKAREGVWRFQASALNEALRLGSNGIVAAGVV